MPDPETTDPAAGTASSLLDGLPEVSTLTTFGGEVLALEPGQARIRYEVTPAYCNPRGVLQGGMFAVFLDDAMGYAVVRLLGPEASFTTTDLTLHYLRPAEPGPVVAEAEVIRHGSRTVYVEGSVRTEDGKLCARASSILIRLG
jgi:uncharacterized protein (TIGR00369 family)